VAESYESFAARLLTTGVIDDPWVDGAPRFALDPVVVSPAEIEALYRAAERIGAVYDEACRIIDADPAHLDFLGLTLAQRLCWESSRPFWHGVARADVFQTAAGPVICELNADTPTGQPEATLLAGLLEGGDPAWLDPNAGLEARFVGMCEAVYRHEMGPEAPLVPTVGLVYPTELTEDLSLIRLYRRWFEARGWRVVLGSPYNLRREKGAIFLFDEACQIIVRHYKTDWWGERRPVWEDAEPFADPIPLVEPLRALVGATIERECVTINPFGSVVPQNKRMMAFFWERLDLFSRGARSVIESLIPRTVRLEAMHLEQLAVEQADWVLKSDYGAEGDEVIVGRSVSESVWRASLLQAAAGRWVVQRHFEARQLAGGEVVNFGVYLVAGEASGVYARVQRGPTDHQALSAAVLVAP
jgi:glutathionylspermidine synthase